MSAKLKAQVGPGCSEQVTDLLIYDATLDVPRSAVPSFEAVAIKGPCYQSNSFPEYNHLDSSSETIFVYPCRRAAILHTEGCTPTAT